MICRSTKMQLLVLKQRDKFNNNNNNKIISNNVGNFIFYIKVKKIYLT